MIAKFRKKKKVYPRQNLFFSILLGALALLVIGFLIVTNWKISQRRTKFTARIDSLKKEIQILEERKRELEEKVSQAGNEEYLEKVAREQLGLKKPGEEVVVVKKESSFAEASEDKEEKKSWWEKIKSIWKR